MAAPKKANPDEPRSGKSILSDRKYPVYLALAVTGLFALNFYLLKVSILYTILAALAAFFTPGYVLLDFFMPKDALEGVVERMMMSVTLSLCFTILYASIVNLWLSQPINREILALILISFNVLTASGRLVSLKFQKKPA
ncbi:MAG: hypothetical protein V1820_05790 [archaeon]